MIRRAEITIIFIIIITIFSATQSNAQTIQWLAAKYPEIMINRSYSHDKIVALTFDDGPDNKITPQILKVLKEKKVNATFFVIGINAAKYPDILKQISQDGHVIGNHSWFHASNYNRDSLINEILDTEKIITKATGQNIHLFRPPFGNLDEQSLIALHDLGFKIIGWSSDSQDWRGISSEKVTSNIFKDVSPGAIILQHSYNNPKLINTISALPEIIDRLRREGYTLVTIPELLINAGPVVVKINQKTVNFSEAKCSPKIINNTLYCPLRTTLEKLGVQIYWNEENKAITIIKNTNIIKMSIGSQVAFVNNRQVFLENPPRIDPVSGQALVPIRFICNSMDALIDFNKNGSHVEINIIYDTQNINGIFSGQLA
ncbi:polysaccharide deacetylase [Desulfofarcimen acetoxidans DSM 771]|jgi:peptidoglycan/xylan/chitin deacetylase (PgdA/CDA1 family)|uniref:Polysaccharide deacetylase n=1 Tax=Desulfofarcimen acetoxidans (strain ATCC 49208 / DSM 771 / KCTC 5769 / VKM B-1644 / 5575) TaxID=485916 RepID=C8VXJ7_DESAS|nr:polysaccharide deacetylase family protein [Desulfofarcimen acetoxidans]ACV62653.1 polysaccharide deacetylase [Desulfofarcimen acetoxidans DSM 771]